MKPTLDLANERRGTGGCGLIEGRGQSRCSTRLGKAGLARERKAGARRSRAALAPHWPAASEAGLGGTTSFKLLLKFQC